MNNNFATYVTTNKIKHFSIPPPLQVLLIRDYCKNNNITFSLPAEELRFDGCYIELMGIIRQCSEISGIIMPSLFMLPKNKKKQDFFFKKCQNNSLELHFIMESMVIKSSKEEVERVSALINLNNAIEESSYVKV